MFISTLAVVTYFLPSFKFFFSSSCRGFFFSKNFCGNIFKLYSQSYPFQCSCASFFITLSLENSFWLSSNFAFSFFLPHVTTCSHNRRIFQRHSTRGVSLSLYSIEIGYFLFYGRVVKADRENTGRNASVTLLQLRRASGLLVLSYA